MKNTSKLFGFIAIVAVIGFSMAAGGGDDDDDGTFVLTDIPAEYNGKWIYFSAAGNFNQATGIPGLDLRGVKK